MLEVEPAQYLKVAEQILQIVLDLSVVPSLARKPYFHTADLKDAGDSRSLGHSLPCLNVMVSMSHMVCLIWKFSRGGRRAAFLPGNTNGTRTANVFACQSKIHILKSSGF